MIEKWFEAFTLMARYAAPDQLGGETVEFTPALAFQGALTLSPGKEITAAGQPALQEHPQLLHEFDVTLAPGDYVRREKDGAIYRVTGRSDSMRAPEFSGLRFAQVNVERRMLPC